MCGAAVAWIPLHGGCSQQAAERQGACAGSTGEPLTAGHGQPLPDGLSRQRRHGTTRWLKQEADRVQLLAHSLIHPSAHPPTTQPANTAVACAASFGDPHPHPPAARLRAVGAHGAMPEQVVCKHCTALCIAGCRPFSSCQGASVRGREVIALLPTGPPPWLCQLHASSIVFFNLHASWFVCVVVALDLRAIAEYCTCRQALLRQLQYVVNDILCALIRQGERRLQGCSYSSFTHPCAADQFQS